MWDRYKVNVWEIWHWLASAFLTDNGTLCDPTQCLCGCHGSHRGWKDIGLLQHNRRWVCHQRWPRLPTPCSRRGKQTLACIYTAMMQYCIVQSLSTWYWVFEVLSHVGLSLVLSYISMTTNSFLDDLLLYKQYYRKHYNRNCKFLSGWGNHSWL